MCIMLREERNDISKETSKALAQDFVFNVGNEPVMRNAVNLTSHFGNTKNLILRAKGYSIPNAVALANILTETLLLGKSKIQKISVDGELPPGMKRMISTIEIIISKN